MIYLDNNATTQPDPRVVDAMLPYLRDQYANPSSPYRTGRRTARAIFEARERVANLIFAASRDILFTSGGTEGNNSALHSALYARPDCRRIVVSAVEHASVLEWVRAKSDQGYDVVEIPMDGEGRLDIEALDHAVDKNTVIVSVMLANNETGILLPIREVVGIAGKYGVPVHCDAVQGVGKISVDISSMGVQFLTISAHKFHGPKGIGALWIQPGMRFIPYLFGGGQELGRRGGTENVASIVGFGEAAKLAAEQLHKMDDSVRLLRDKLTQSLLSRISGSRLHGGQSPRLPNTAHLSLSGVEAEILISMLDREGIYCSTGSACMAGSPEPSHVLQAMGVDPPILRESVRFGLSRFTTQQEIDQAIETIVCLVKKLQSMPSEEEGDTRQSTRPS